MIKDYILRGTYSKPSSLLKIKSSLFNDTNDTNDTFNNEDLLNVIVKMLNDQYFSFLLETRHSYKKELISKYVKKMTLRSLESSDSRDLLLKIYRSLRNIWIKEKRTELSLKKDFEMCDKLDVVRYRSAGYRSTGYRSTGYRPLYDNLFKEVYPNIDQEVTENLMLDLFPSYLDYSDISLILEEGEDIARFLAAKKSLEEVSESYPILELYKPKKHFRLELIRGRAPGILSLVS